MFLNYCELIELRHNRQCGILGDVQYFDKVIMKYIIKRSVSHLSDVRKVCFSHPCRE